MRLEFLLQFIVPLTFLAIWALTSLLNRDAQPLPPRPGAGRGPGIGPARGGVGGGFSPSTRGDLTRPASRPLVRRPRRPIGPRRRAGPRRPRKGRPGSGPTRAVDEGIVIIESETRGAGLVVVLALRGGLRDPAARGDRPGGAKAASRARSAPAPIKPWSRNGPGP